MTIFGSGLQVDILRYPLTHGLSSPGLVFPCSSGLNPSGSDMSGGFTDHQVESLPGRHIYLDYRVASPKLDDRPAVFLDRERFQSRVARTGGRKVDEKLRILSRKALGGVWRQTTYMNRDSASTRYTVETNALHWFDADLGAA